MVPTRAYYRIFRTLMKRWNENNLALPAPLVRLS